MEVHVKEICSHWASKLYKQMERNDAQAAAKTQGEDGGSCREGMIPDTVWHPIFSGKHTLHFEGTCDPTLFDDTLYEYPRHQPH